MDDDQFKVRVQTIVADLGGLGPAARKLGISTSMLSKYQRGESDPTRGKMWLMAKKAGVEMGWLVTGNGDAESGRDIIDVPVYDAQLSAGDGAISDRIEVISHAPFNATYLTTISGKTDYSGLAMFQTRGDSMHPTISDRDFVMVDLHDTLHRDGVFAIALGDQARIKRLQHTFTGTNIVSDNQDTYQQETLTGNQVNELQIIGRVIWRMGRV